MKTQITMTSSDIKQAISEYLNKRGLKDITLNEIVFKTSPIYNDRSYINMPGSYDTSAIITIKL